MLASSFGERHIIRRIGGEREREREERERERERMRERERERMREMAGIIHINLS